MQPVRLLFLVTVGVTACTIEVNGSFERPAPTNPASASSTDGKQEAGPDAAAPRPDAPAPEDAAPPAIDEPVMAGSDARDGDAPLSRACHPRLMRAVADPSFKQRDTMPPTCSIDEHGTLAMSYPTVDNCPVFSDKQRPYRACYFGQNEDVSAFHRGRGLFEARYCFEGPLFDDVNIWFDTQAEPSTALTFLRLHRTDDATARSCRRVLLSVNDSCVSEGKCNAGCVDTRAPAADAAPAMIDATADDAGGDGAASGDGPVQSAGLLSCESFQRVKVRITAEWCQCPSGCARPRRAEVRLLSLVYYPEDCVCTSNRDCGPGTYCRKDALPADADCWKRGDCQGVCTP